MTEDLFTRKQIENAVMLAADLYQGMYNSPATDGGALEVAGTVIDEACRMEQVYQRLLVAVFCELIRAHIAVTSLPFIPNFIPNGLPSTLFCYFPHEQEVQHRVG